MENKKNLIFWGGALLVGAGLIFYSYISAPVKQTEQPVDNGVVQSPVSTATPNSAFSPVPSLTTKPTEEPFIGLRGVKAPATCQVGGEINFSDKNTFSSKDLKISWQNIDSQGRLIKWRISPQDGLMIGPNIFANLNIRNGEYESLTVRLPENPISKTYLLTASVTYGQIIQGDVKVKEANCSGQVKVNINF